MTLIVITILKIMFLVASIFYEIFACFFVEQYLENKERKKSCIAGFLISTYSIIFALFGIINCLGEIKWTFPLQFEYRNNLSLNIYLLWVTLSVFALCKYYHSVKCEVCSNKQDENENNDQRLSDSKLKNNIKTKILAIYIEYILILVILLVGLKINAGVNFKKEIEPYDYDNVFDISFDGSYMYCDTEKIRPDTLLRNFEFIYIEVPEKVGGPQARAFANELSSNNTGNYGEKHIKDKKIAIYWHRKVSEDNRRLVFYEFIYENEGLINNLYNYIYFPFEYIFEIK